MAHQDPSLPPESILGSTYVCRFAAIEKKRAETFSAYRFLNCNDAEEGCVLNCNSKEQMKNSTVALIFSVVKEAYQFARYLYALQKSVESGKDFFEDAKTQVRRRIDSQDSIER